MADTLHLTVSTPDGAVLDNDVDFVLMRTVEGDMGILRGHEPCAVALDYGILRAFSDKKPAGILAVLGGFATVMGDRVTVLTDFAEAPDRLEEALAEREKRRAERRVYEQRSYLELQRAEAAIRHALVHIDISAYSILKGRDEST